MPNNVADAILNILTGAGVKTIYGVLGDAIFPLLDALAVSCTGSIEVFKQNNIHCSYPVDGAVWELRFQKPSELKSLYHQDRKMQKKNLIPFGYEIAATDFTIIASAWGIKGYRIQNPVELESSLAHALNSENSTLIEVLTADAPLPFLK